MISVKARDKGLELIVEVDETMPYLLIGDDVRLKQVILNVLTNAVKYTEKGSVTMRVEGKKADDQNIYFHVCIKDTGIGIKEEDIQKLFSPFERIEENRNRTIEGTGLGMSIVKQLLAMMDSKLEVQSVYGEGSEFSFTVRQQVVDWKPIGNYAVKYRESVASMERYQEAFHAPTAKILVTDDTEMNLTVLKGLLKATRIQVDTATSGKETLEKAKQQKYDVMFIDHRMPEMDGIETLAALKTLEGNLNLNTPCISLTANAVSGARETYMKAGFQDYMTKPVDGRKLEELLLRYLPEEKVEKVTAKQIDAAEEKALPEHAGTPDPELQVYSGIELDTALQNCGSKEVLLQVIEEFALGIEKKANAIEEYEKAKDYKNYTVLVHALKSSARLIGATKLSEMAAELESLGNEEKEAEIKEKTPKLLEVYRGYREHLAAALPKEVSPEEDTRELLSEEMWQEVMQGLKEFLEAFDFDSADSAFAMLSDYRIPEAHKERYMQLKEGLAAVDRDGLLELMES
jgi:CheY-like chemotaxis protein/HPt (histidine-containing phosphotransfer) domain-containing protein/anti-sigma regulatory factor (Ser/Thr protein kinase)